MKVVTIGAGLMASAIQAEMPDVTILGHDAIDVTSQDSIVAAFREHQPDVAIYCAAYHRLMECEGNPTLAFDVNARGVERVARLVPTVYLSTDYVFSDGGPHEEVLPGRQPRSVYGRSKLAGELAALENDGIVVRISGVFDERFQSHKGLSFPEMVARSYDELKLPSDQIFSPTYAKDAAMRIVALVDVFAAKNSVEPPAKGVLVHPSSGYGGGFFPGPNGIYHAANAGATSWADFAVVVNDLLGRRQKIKHVEMRDALRPRSSALLSTRLPSMRAWLSALIAWRDAREALLKVAA